jgi:hypothetical protein
MDMKTVVNIRFWAWDVERFDGVDHAAAVASVVDDWRGRIEHRFRGSEVNISIMDPSISSAENSRRHVVVERISDDGSVVEDEEARATVYMLKAHAIQYYLGCNIRSFCRRI